MLALVDVSFIDLFLSVPSKSLVFPIKLGTWKWFPHVPQLPTGSLVVFLLCYKKRMTKINAQAKGSNHLPRF